jgi:hypothetical protein
MPRGATARLRTAILPRYAESLSRPQTRSQSRVPLGRGSENGSDDRKDRLAVTRLTPPIPEALRIDSSNLTIWFRLGGFRDTINSTRGIVKLTKSRLANPIRGACDSKA